MNNIWKKTTVILGALGFITTIGTFAMLKIVCSGGLLSHWSLPILGQDSELPLLVPLPTQPIKSRTLSPNYLVRNINLIISDANSITQSPPPDIETIHDGYRPILSLDTSLYKEFGSGCEGPRQSILTVVDYVKDDYSIETITAILEDNNRVRQKYHLGVDQLSNADRSWIPVIFVHGRRLRVQYFICGSGGIRLSDGHIFQYKKGTN